jgi:deoxyribodipyrimidine photo-lyase
MWFASIWIFTLRLPWTLGADFFLRHLLDADAASNTLSWRWVAGLQTAGKTYLATAENIARFTNGRFEPSGLATSAMPLPAIAAPAAQPIVDKGRYNGDKPALLLVTHEDLAPESLFRDARAVAGVAVASDDSLLWGNAARTFARKGAEDAAARAARYYGCQPTMLPHLDAVALTEMARALAVDQIVTPNAPVGPVAGALDDIAAALAPEDIRLVQVRRDWDNRLWPHATKGFFPFKEQLPSALRELGML